MYQIWHDYVLDDVTRTKSHVKNHKFDLVIKGQSTCIGIMIHTCAKHGKPMSKQKKSYGPDMKTSQNSLKFDIEVIVQCRIGIMNVRETSSHGDTPMWRICKQISKQKKI